MRSGELAGACHLLLGHHEAMNRAFQAYDLGTTQSDAIFIVEYGSFESILKDQGFPIARSDGLNDGASEAGNVSAFPEQNVRA